MVWILTKETQVSPDFVDIAHYEMLLIWGLMFDIQDSDSHKHCIHVNNLHIHGHVAIKAQTAFNFLLSNSIIYIKPFDLVSTLY